MRRANIFGLLRVALFWASAAFGQIINKPAGTVPATQIFWMLRIEPQGVHHHHRPRTLAGGCGAGLHACEARRQCEPTLRNKCTECATACSTSDHWDGELRTENCNLAVFKDI